MLVAAHADLNHENRWGRTALTLAARQGHDDVVSYLISQKCDVNFSLPASALAYAVWQDHLSTAKLRVNAGAELNPTPHPVNANPNAWGPIAQEAAISGDPAMVDFVLDHGANLNERDGHGETALDKMVDDGASPAMIAHLLERGADPNLRRNDGTTALMRAVALQNPGVIRLLLEHGANVNNQDLHGRTALLVAAARKQPEEVRQLLANHPEVNLPDDHGETALTYAADRGAVEIVRLLERAGARAPAFHLIPKEAWAPLSPAQQWALAVGAIYTQWNGDSHHALATYSSNRDEYRALLKSALKVRDRATFLATLSRFDGRPNWVELVTEEGLALTRATGPFDFLVRLQKMELADVWWRDRLNAAWDICRVPNVVRSGVTAGYLSEAEAWPLLLDNARLAQRTFTSWREMDDCFLARRDIWNGGRDPELELCSALLLNPHDPNSPWNQLAWSTNLGK
jgi:ankyrin repeat protein